MFAPPVEASNFLRRHTGLLRRPLTEPDPCHRPKPPSSAMAWRALQASHRLRWFSGDQNKSGLAWAEVMWSVHVARCGESPWTPSG